MKSRFAAGLLAAIVLSIVFTLVIFANGGDQDTAYQSSVDKNVNESSLSETLQPPGTDERIITDGYKVFLPGIHVAQQPCAAAPTLILPANGSQINTLIPMFNWDNGNDPAVTTLRLQVATDPNMQDWIWTLWSSGPTTGIKEYRDSENFDPATTYYWQAWLECDEFESPKSDVWSFTTGAGGMILPGPSLIAPGHQTVLSSLPQTFEWSGIGGAVEYIIHWRTIGRSGYTYGRTAFTNYEINWLESAKIYEWWVTARNEYAYGNDSAYWLFKSPEIVPAGQPTLIGDGIDLEDFQNGNKVIRNIVDDQE